MVIPFEYWRGTSISIGTTAIAANTTKDPIKIAGTYAGVLVEDLFEYDDKDYLFHVRLEMYPKYLQVYPFWIAGYQQSDYHDILSSTKDSAFGFLTTPLDVIAIPEAHLEFAIKNPDKVLTVLPLIYFENAIYNVKYVVDPDIVEAVLRRRLRLPWFPIYGHKAFPYDFKDKMAITRPIPLTATRAEIEAILREWKALGEWTS